MCRCRNVLSSQEVVDFVSERIKPDESGSIRSISSIAEEVRRCLLDMMVSLNL